LKKKGNKNMLIAVIAIVVVVALIAVVVLGGFLNGNEKYGLEKIKAQGQIVMWCEATFLPFESYDPLNNTFYGFDIDLANRITENVSAALNMTITLKIEDKVFANIPAALKNNQADISLSGWTITPERNKTVLFSEPYYQAEAGYGIMTTNTSNNIANVDDLVSKMADGTTKLVVNTGTTSELWVTEKLVNTGKIRADQVRSLPTIANCVQDVKSGYSIAFIIDKPTVDTYVDESNGELKNAGTIAAVEPYGACMNPKSTDLKAIVDDVITKMYANGEMAALRAKWGL
jgi:ABC-type amino acid transport substrate-binding protein